jgi:hypothetical protein
LKFIGGNDAAPSQLSLTAVSLSWLISNSSLMWEPSRAETAVVIGMVNQKMSGIMDIKTATLCYIMILRRNSSTYFPPEIGFKRDDRSE